MMDEDVEKFDDTKVNDKEEENGKPAKKRGRNLKKKSEKRTAFDGRKVIFVTLCTQTDWDWKDKAEKTGKGAFLTTSADNRSTTSSRNAAQTSVVDKENAKSDSHQSLDQMQSETEVKQSTMTVTDLTPLFFVPDDQYGIPLAEMSSDSDSSEGDNLHEPKHYPHHLPSVGPPQILRYIGESETQEKKTEKEISSLEASALDWRRIQATMFSGICEFCGIDVKSFPTLDQQLSQPPESLYCCQEYREFVEFAINATASLEEEVTKSSQQISVAVHAHHGSNQERLLAKERAVQRMQERAQQRREQEASQVQAALSQTATAAAGRAHAGTAHAGTAAPFSTMSGGPSEHLAEDNPQFKDVDLQGHGENPRNENDTVNEDEIIQSKEDEEREDGKMNKDGGIIQSKENEERKDGKMKREDGKIHSKENEERKDGKKKKENGIIQSKENEERKDGKIKKEHGIIQGKENEERKDGKIKREDGIIQSKENEERKDGKIKKENGIIQSKENEERKDGKMKRENGIIQSKENEERKDGKMKKEDGETNVKGKDGKNIVETEAVLDGRKKEVGEQQKRRRRKKVSGKGGQIGVANASQQYQNLSSGVVPGYAASFSFNIEEPLPPSMIATGELQDRPMIEKFYADGSKFLTIFPDGTGNVFYPSGRLSIIIMSASLGQNTYIVQDDSDRPAILAVFEPTGCGCCSFANGKVRLIFDQIGGLELDYAGGRKKSWSWKDQETHVHVPPFQPIVFRLNSYLGIRFMAQENIALTLTGKTRSCRFNVGSRLKAVSSERIPSKAVEDHQLVITKHKVKVETILNKITNFLKFPKSPKVDYILPPLSVSSRKQKVDKMKPVLATSPTSRKLHQAKQTKLPPLDSSAVSVN